MRSTEKLADRDTYITMPNHAKMHRTVYLFELSFVVCCVHSTTKKPNITDLSKSKPQRYKFSLAEHLKVTVAVAPRWW